MPEHNLYLVFLKPLHKLGINYCVTGSVASIIYGEPRLTHDVDLVLELNDLQIDQLFSEFPQEQFYMPPKEIIVIEKKRSERGHFNILHLESGFKADIYFVGQDKLLHWAVSNFNEYYIEGEIIRVAPPEYVIIKKLQYYQEGNIQKHIIDIEGILRQSKDLIKFDHLDELIKRYHLNKEWDLVKKV